MMEHQQQKRRKILFINPWFQGGTALAFAAVIFAGGALFSWLLYRDIAWSLREASVAGHFRFQSAYEIVGGSVARHIALLYAGVLLAGIAVFLLIVRGIRAGTERLAAVFRLSAEGDLSTPTDAPGPRELASLGRQLDAARARTLDTIDGIRAEVDFMRKESLSPDEFQRHWDGLKEKIGRFAP